VASSGIGSDQLRGGTDAHCSQAIAVLLQMGNQTAVLLVDLDEVRENV
jgi:hypothetical protein